ncbi:UvrY/SirA/GacA family response regulator transcription factor [Fulvivirga kasyanovii]|uniref:Response regulator transcription factor n=1 Tax=Fulvivirga kasyanovii TaxID=396812 RepID=A0ABW9RTF6_9BACT|nr:response regulator transcription factor [Fulvivirga kasyanovii]MTI26295.1 response regulator transcription factor [Fulvivirga kasyanovii]
MNQTIKLALVDDHKLFRGGLRSLIESISDRYVVAFEADNGLDLQQKLDSQNPPDIILIDVNMPEMNGFETVEWLSQHFPNIRILVLSMIEKEETVVKMLKLGVKGYLCKDAEPSEFKEALSSVYSKGYYYTDFVTGKLIHSLKNDGVQSDFYDINEREREFLKLACSEMTYNQIADQMCLSPKTIDGYRMSLFEKFNIKSRVGLVLWAIKNGLIEY